jgi:Flp pilus assembly protein TadD
MDPNPIPIQQATANGPLSLGIPGNLVFDDDPLEPMLYRTEPTAPTPASVLELWERGLDRSEACARALAAVLVQNHDLISRIGDLDAAERCLRLAADSKTAMHRGAPLAACFSALGRILELKNQMDEAESFYRQALELQEKTLGAGHEATLATAISLIHLLEGSDRKEEAASLRNRLRAESLSSHEDDSSLWRLLVSAHTLFVAGQYAAAEAVYRRLVKKQFELGSVHCHLARVCLITDRESEARREVDRAWDVRHKSPAYVLVRIHCLKTLLEMLAGGNWRVSLKEVKSALAEPGAHMDWTMRPVLDHLKPRLDQEAYDLMTAIVAAMSQKARVCNLESNPLWKSICGGDEAAATAASAGESSTVSTDRPPETGRQRLDVTIIKQ